MIDKTAREILIKILEDKRAKNKGLHIKLRPNCKKCKELEEDIRKLKDIKI